MSLSNDTPSLRAPTGLWCYEHRDRSITRAVLAGASCTLLAQIYGLTPVRLDQIVRKTCAGASRLAGCRGLSVCLVRASRHVTGAARGLPALSRCGQRHAGQRASPAPPLLPTQEPL